MSYVGMVLLQVQSNVRMETLQMEMVVHQLVSKKLDGHA